jgi:hypothetical protein
MGAWIHKNMRNVGIEIPNSSSKRHGRYLNAQLGKEVVLALAPRQAAQLGHRLQDRSKSSMIASFPPSLSPSLPPSLTPSLPPSPPTSWPGPKVTRQHTHSLTPVPSTETACPRRRPHRLSQRASARQT